MYRWTIITYLPVDDVLVLGVEENIILESALVSRIKKGVPTRFSVIIHSVLVTETNILLDRLSSHMLRLAFLVGVITAERDAIQISVHYCPCT